VSKEMGGVGTPLVVPNATRPVGKNGQRNSKKKKNRKKSTCRKTKGGGNGQRETGGGLGIR